MRIGADQKISSTKFSEDLETSGHLFSQTDVGIPHRFVGIKEHLTDPQRLILHLNGLKDSERLRQLQEIQDQLPTLHYSELLKLQESFKRLDNVTTILAEITKEVAKKTPVNQLDEKGFPCLARAIIEDPQSVAELLLQGADPKFVFPPDHPEIPNMSLTQVAAIMGEEDVLKLLMSYGAQFEANYLFPQDHSEFPGMTLTQTISLSGTVDQLKLLLKYGANPNVLLPFEHRLYSGRSLVEVAIAEKDDDFLRLLAAKGANIADSIKINLATTVDSQQFKVPASSHVEPASQELLTQHQLGNTAQGLKDKLEQIFRSIFMNPIDTIRLEDDGVIKTTTQAQLLEGLSAFLDSVEEREILTGTPNPNTHPEAFKKFYDDILNMLQHIFIQLSDPEVDADLKKAALTTVYQGYLQCGTRRFQETSLALSLIKPDFVSSVETGQNQVEKLLYHQRVNAFNRALPDFDVHTYNAYMSVLGETYGVATNSSSYYDPLGHVGDVEDFAKLVREQYATNLIVQNLYESARSKTEIAPGVIPGLLADFKPDFSKADELTGLEKIKGELSKQDQTRLLELAGRDREVQEKKRLKRDLKQSVELSADERNELNILNKLAKQGNLSDKQFVHYQQLLDDKSTEEEEFDQKVLADNGYPTETGIFYLLMAMGTLKPKSLEGIEFSPLILQLITKKKKELEKAKPGSERHQQLSQWLEGI